MRFDAGATSRGAAHAVSSHLREVLDKIAVEDQPMSPLTDDAGVEEEKNEDSPERNCVAKRPDSIHGVSGRIAGAAPAPRRRGTLGLDGNTRQTPAAESPRWKLAAMLSPGEEDVSGTLARRADASINTGGAARGLPPRPRIGWDRALSLQPFLRRICAQEDCWEGRLRRCGRG